MIKADKISFILIACTLILGFSSITATVWAADKEEIKQEKAEIRSMSKETLARLYKLKPSAQQAISTSAGYAVFSNFGTKIIIVGGGSGKGIVIDNASEKETFMKMIELQTGIGLGIKKFRLVWVFEKQKDMTDFINSGWEFAGQTSAVAKLDDEGGGFSGAMSVSPGIWLYQLTDDGLALELTVKGTKIYKDKDLN